MSSQEVVDACNAGNYSIEDPDPVNPPDTVLDPSALRLSSSAAGRGLRAMRPLVGMWIWSFAVIVVATTTMGLLPHAALSS
jgi:hypothetical protein